MLNKDKTIECTDCRDKSGAFNLLTQEESEELCSGKTHISYRAGEDLIKQGSFATKIIYLRQGVVKVFTEYRSRTLILSLETSGTFLGLPVLFGMKTFPYSVQAFERAECCQFDVNDFQKIIVKNGAFAAGIMQQMNDYTLRSFDRLNTLTTKQLPGRLADIILCLSDRIYKSHLFEMALARKDLAELSAMSVESLSRIIREFNDDRIIRLEGRTLEILNMEKLRRISEVS